jgi:hypothetical protein
VSALFMLAMLAVPAVVLGSQDGPAYETMHGGVKVVAALRCDAARDAQMDFRLTNISAKPVTLRSDRYPWTGRGALTLALLELGTSTVIGQVSAISDVLPASETLLPGESAEGTIAIRDRLPSAARIVAARDVVLVWGFELTIEGQEALPIYHAELLTKKSLCMPVRKE